MRSPAKVALALTGLVAIGLLGYAGKRAYDGGSSMLEGLLEVARAAPGRKTDPTMTALSHMQVEPIAGEITKLRGNSTGAAAAQGAWSPKGIRVRMEPGTAAWVGKFHSWVKGPRAPREHKVRLMFMLRRSEEMVKLLEEKLLAVSTPGNPLYGQHYTKEQAYDLAPPLPGSAEAVLQWLESFGVKGEGQVQLFSDAIRVHMTVATAEEMLDTILHEFVHKDQGLVRIRAAAPYSVPQEVAWALYIVGGLVQLPTMDKPVGRQDANTTKRSQWKVKARSESRQSSGDDDNEEGDSHGEEEPFGESDCQSCEGFTTPGVLHRSYNLPEAPEGQGTIMSISEFQGVSWDPSDVNAFAHSCGLDNEIKPQQKGPNYSKWCQNLLIQDICLESLLDIEYIGAIAGDVPLYVIAHDDYLLFEWAIDAINMEDRPNLFSVSYGDDERQQQSAEYMVATNTQFMLMGLQGLTVLFASGDMGVYGRIGITDDGKFHPDFPASSPYVTAVGGTQFKTMGVIGDEAAWPGSGGGFSEIFPQPEWQSEAVEDFLVKAGNMEEGECKEKDDDDGDDANDDDDDDDGENDDPPACEHNGGLPSEDRFQRKGRGYPDVSALGGTDNPYCVVVHGPFHSHMALGVGGTSASCPVVAGMFARINAARAKAGKPAMGFLNPFLYQNPGAFYDVKLGDNSWEGDVGFKALAGWDPATGLGTPNFEKLQAAAMQVVEPILPTPQSGTLEPPHMVWDP